MVPGTKDSDEKNSHTGYHAGSNLLYLNICGGKRHGERYLQAFQWRRYRSAGVPRGDFRSGDHVGRMVCCDAGRYH